jgi:hypothetical protein
MPAATNALRLRGNFLSGTVSDNPLLVSATTLNSANLATLPVVDSAHHMALTLDPSGLTGSPEIVWVTAHSAAATSATILRAQEGTSARQFSQNTTWINAPTKLDYTLPYLGETGIGDRVWNRGTATAHALDDEFNDGSLDPAWTRIDQNANSVVYTEAADLLSINHAGGDGATFAAHHLVKPLGGMTYPVTIEAAFRMFRRYATNYQMFGLCMTSGTTTAASAIVMRPYGNTGVAFGTTLSGGWYAAISGGETTGIVSPELAMEGWGGPLYQRLRWSAANTFQMYWSGDGVGWYQYPTTSITQTFTPTHVGFCMSTWGGTNRCFGSLEYFRVTAS